MIERITKEATISKAIISFYEPLVNYSFFSKHFLTINYNGSNFIFKNTV